MIGDYLGNRELQNLIKYPRETIVFHNVVRKTSTAETARQNAFCLPNGANWLRQFDLEVLPTNEVGVFTSYDELCDALADHHSKVAKSSMSSSEEGAVLTFLRYNEEDEQTVISMCKVKSVEYQTLSYLVNLLQ